MFAILNMISKYSGKKNNLQKLIFSVFIITIFAVLIQTY